MRKALLTAVLAVVGAWVFAQVYDWADLDWEEFDDEQVSDQKRIAVFPFVDMDKVFNENQAFMFYQEFSNEFKNRMPESSVVPRLDVERLITIEANFQLTNFSAQEKTAEMNRVLNGNQILSGYIAKVENKIRITVCLFTYPNLDRLPGGITKSVSNITELFNIIPELIQDMQNVIAGRSTSSGGRPLNPVWEPEFIPEPPPLVRIVIPMMPLPPAVNPLVRINRGWESEVLDRLPDNFSYPNAELIDYIGDLKIIPNRIYRLQVGFYKQTRNAVEAFDRLLQGGYSPAYEPFGDGIRVVMSGIRAEDVQAVSTGLGVLGFKEVAIRPEN